MKSFRRIVASASLAACLFAASSIVHAQTAGPPPLMVTTSSLPYGIVGSPYSAQLSASGGSGAYTWSASGLPPGLILNTRSGSINGTPTQGGTYSVTVTVQDLQFE